MLYFFEHYKVSVWRSWKGGDDVDSVYVGKFGKQLRSTLLMIYSMLVEMKVPSRVSSTQEASTSTSTSI